MPLPRVMQRGLQTPFTGRIQSRWIVILALLAVAAIVAISWFSLHPRRFDRSKTYVIGYGNDVPLHFKGPDGQPTGLAVELVREAARRKGIKLEWVEKPSSPVIVDLTVLHAIRPERAKVVHFSAPYLQTQSCFLVPASSPIRDLADLRTARISHVNYAVHRTNLARILPAARLLPVGSSREAVQRVIAGDSDAAFVNEYAVVESLLRGGDQISLRILPAHATRTELGLSATFATAAVADELRDGLRDMAEAGQVKPILERWAYFPQLASDIMGDLIVAERQIRWLAIGFVGVSLIFILAVGLAVLSRRRTAQLRRTEKLLHQVAARVPGMVYQFRLRPDGTSCLPYASEAIQQIFRLNPEEVQQDASAAFALIHPADDEALHASIRESAAHLTPWICEFRLRFADGTERWLLGNALPQRDADGATLWHGFINDITERKDAEAALHALERKIQETQKLESLGVLAGGIAHDFNNILTGILGNASLAGIEIPAGSRAHQFLTSIKQGSMRAAELCKQMLAYSGKGRFVVKPVALNKLVEETVQLLQHSISKQAVLRFNLAQDLPRIEADATQLRQVIMNLVINASEAIGPTSGMINVNTGVIALDQSFLRGTVLAPELPAGNYVYLEVCDTGCGMSSETQAKIFDPFFTTKFTGRGLGLAAVLGIVRGHHGALKVDSSPDRGTTFKVLFPCAPDTAVLVVADDNLPKPAWRGQGCVLVVDDEEAVRSTAAMMLETLGFEVVLASDGDEALEIFRTDPRRFSLVLTDLTMPRLGGRDLFAKLRPAHPGVKVILMSGFNEPEAVSEFAGPGPAGFLQKPFQLEDLSEKIQAVLGKPN